MNLNYYYYVLTRKSFIMLLNNVRFEEHSYTDKWSKIEFYDDWVFKTYYGNYSLPKIFLLKIISLYLVVENYLKSKI